MRVASRAEALRRASAQSEQAKAAQGFRDLRIDPMRRSVLLRAAKGAYPGRAWSRRTAPRSPPAPMLRRDPGVILERSMAEHGGAWRSMAEHGAYKRSIAPATVDACPMPYSSRPNDPNASSTFMLRSGPRRTPCEGHERHERNGRCIGRAPPGGRIARRRGAGSSGLIGIVCRNGRRARLASPGAA